MIVLLEFAHLFSNLYMPKACMFSLIRGPKQFIGEELPISLVLSVISDEIYIDVC